MNLKLAVRRLLKTPFVSLVAIVSLALGIGANAAIFSLYDQTLLRPLPVVRPSELINLSSPGPKPGSNSCGQAGSCDEIFSYPMFRDIERLQTVFTGRGGTRSLRGQSRLSRADPERAGRARVGVVLSSARPPASTGTSLHCRRRSQHRQPFRDGPQPRLLDHDTRFKPGRAQRHDRRQRPGSDRHWRRAARIFRDDARQRAEGVRAADDEGIDVAGLEGIRGSTGATGRISLRD